MTVMSPERSKVKNDGNKVSQRLEAIVKVVDQRGFATVQELSELCNASVMTIRRDLVYLHAKKLLQRTHGGAAALKAAVQPLAPDDAAAALPTNQSVYNRLNVLITAEPLPRLSSLIQDRGGRTDSHQPIPVIAESLPMPDSVTYVSVDNHKAGFDLGAWAGQYALEHWAGKATILDLTYHRPNTVERSQGFLQGVRSVIPEARLLFSINTQASYAMAYQLCRDALSVHKDINLIFAINDTSARGAYDACRALGIAQDQLIILTFGIEGPAMIELILKGQWVRAGVSMFPEVVAIVCVEAAIAAYQGKPLPPQLITPYCIATRENLLDIYEKTPAGWRFRWDAVPCRLPFPLPVDVTHPDRNRQLPDYVGFICTFVEHDWYRSLNRVMKEYTAQLGIHLEAMEFQQTLKDELHLRQIEIARRAAHEVKSGDTIFIDSGPISTELAEQLASLSGTAFQNVTVITNSMAVLERLKDSPGDITLISTGGAYRRSSQAFVGPTTEATLKEFRIDKLFLMASGVSKGFGISHTNISEVTIKQLMIRASREVILLVDYSCFQQESLIQVAPISVVHKIITDDALAPSIRLELGTLGISVILASM